jgi:hypothetical protein
VLIDFATMLKLLLTVGACFQLPETTHNVPPVATIGHAIVVWLHILGDSSVIMGAGMGDMNVYTRRDIILFESTSNLLPVGLVITYIDEALLHNNLIHSD